jgi:hypothetical protein
MVTKLFFLFLSLFGWKPAAPPVKVVAETGSLSPIRPPIRTEAREIRDAVATLDRFERAHVLGVARPSAETAATAWSLIENLVLPLAGFLRACTHLGQSWPLCPRGADPDLWLTNTLELIASRLQMVITAIRAGVRMKAWRAVENIMARDVEHQLRGCKPTVIYPGGPEARREVHLRDSYRSAEHPEGRVILAKLFEHGRGGWLEIAEAGGGQVSRETVKRSGWTIHEGWIGVGGGGPRPNRRLTENGDAPRSENTPTPASRP